MIRKLLVTSAAAIVLGMFATAFVAAQQDDFPAGRSQELTGPANDAEIISVVSGNTALGRVSRAIRNNSEDVVTVYVKMRGGSSAHPIKSIQPGAVLPYRITMVYGSGTGTTATEVEILY